MFIIIIRVPIDIRQREPLHLSQRKNLLFNRQSEISLLRHADKDNNDQMHSCRLSVSLYINELESIFYVINWQASNESENQEM